MIRKMESEENICYSFVTPNAPPARRPKSGWKSRASLTRKDIKTENPQKEELKEWYKKSGLPLKRFFNTSGMLYKQMNLKDKLPEMSEEEQLELLATDGMLVKRPIVVEGDIVLTGFKAAEWEKLRS